MVALIIIMVLDDTMDWVEPYMANLDVGVVDIS